MNRGSRDDQKLRSHIPCACHLSDDLNFLPAQPDTLHLATGWSSAIRMEQMPIRPPHLAEGPMTSVQLGESGKEGCNVTHRISTDHRWSTSGLGGEGRRKKNVRRVSILHVGMSTVSSPSAVVVSEQSDPAPASRRGSTAGFWYRAYAADGHALCCAMMTWQRRQAFRLHRELWIRAR